MLKIAVTGPESTGKTELSEKLAAHYKTIVVPEYAREYLNRIDREYNFEDLDIIARHQIEQQEKLEKKANKILICDTELTVIKIWAEHKYKKCPEWLSQNLIKYSYDLYLLCDIDLPWEFDPQREHPNLRSYFFDLYLQELRQKKVNYAVISGKGEKRLQNAIRVIEKLINV